MDDAKPEAFRRRTITVSWLRKLDASADHVELFAKTFGDRAEITPELISRASRVGLDLDWAAKRLLTASARSEYERAMASAWSEYGRVMASAWSEFERATASAWSEFERATVSARSEYGRVTASAWSEFERAMASARSEYGRVMASAWSEFERATAEFLIGLFTGGDHDEGPSDG